MTYEYVCEACGHQWEAEQSIKDNPLKKCVSCGVDKAKRLVSGGTGFLLKGGGWYADLYGSPGAGSKSDDKSKGAAAASTKPDAGKSESAPAKSDVASSDSKPAAASTASSGSTTTTTTSTSAAS